MSQFEKLNDEEIATLRKSLNDLGFEEARIEQLIQKAIKKSDDEKETAAQETIEDQAAAGKKDSKEPITPETKEEEPEETEGEKAKKEYEIMKCRMDELKKAFPDLDGEGAKTQGDDLRKSIEDELTSSMQDKFGSIIKGLSDELGEVKNSYDEIIKGLKKDIQRIGDTPLPMKSVIHNVNFFEKSLNSEIGNKDDNSGITTLSISKDKDELLKSMQDTLEKETDPIMKEMLLDGISDYSINSTPNTHGVRAITYVSRKNNITLTQ